MEPDRTGEAGDRGSRALRCAKRVLGGLAVFLVLLAVAGASYEAIGTARDARKFPPPGRLVDVGGHRLHLYCTGTGSPTVVLETGMGGFSIYWIRVQPEVAKFTRVCSYDRAGLGWSEPGPEPRTVRQFVTELRALLKNAGATGPYVIVGHSLGGFTARFYASHHPEEVAGAVLVDSSVTGDWLKMNTDEKTALDERVRMNRRYAYLARIGGVRTLAALMQAGVMKPPGGAASILEELPEGIRPVRIMAWVQPKFFSTVASQYESLPESAAQVAAAGGLGDLPLIVLTAGDAEPAREHRALAQLSSRGKHAGVPGSGHQIHLERPAAVVDAIREVVEQARTQARN